MYHMSNDFSSMVIMSNMLLCVVMFYNINEIFSWFIMYEMSMLTLITVLSSEGRGYSKNFALWILIIISALGAAVLLVSFSNITNDYMGINILNIIYFSSITLMTKVPSWPFFMWLPEAHVEASMTGSVMLAAFSLKFSFFGMFLFLINALLKLELVMMILIFGIFLSSLLMFNNIDIKKIIAYCSTLHMSIGLLFIYMVNYCMYEWANMLWTHHSVTASFLFLIIGMMYVLTGSSILKLMSNFNNYMMIIMWTLVLTYSIDFPWSVSSMMETAIISLHSKISFILISFINFMLFTALILLLGKLTLKSEIKFVNLNSKNISLINLFMVFHSSVCYSMI